MQQCYAIIKRDHLGNVINVYCVDTNKIIALDIECIMSPQERRGTIANILLQHLNDHNIFFTKQYQDIYDYSLDNSMHWECFMLDLNAPKCSCAYILPALGNIFNCYNLLSGAFVTFMALQTSGSEDNNNLIYLSATGALLNFSLNIIIYVYSDASIVLGKLGWNIDNRLRDEYAASDSRPLFSLNNNQKLAYQNCINFCVIILILLNITISAIRLWREHSLLKSKFLDSFHDLSKDQRAIYDDLIDWLVIYLGISAGVYSAFAFQASFALKISNRLQKSKIDNGGYHPIVYQYQSVNNPLNRAEIGEQDLEQQSFTPVI